MTCKNKCNCKNKKKSCCCCRGPTGTTGEQGIQGIPGPTGASGLEQLNSFSSYLNIENTSFPINSVAIVPLTNATFGGDGKWKSNVDGYYDPDSQFTTFGSFTVTKEDKYNIQANVLLQHNDDSKDAINATLYLYDPNTNVIYGTVQIITPASLMPPTFYNATFGVNLLLQAGTVLQLGISTAFSLFIFGSQANKETTFSATLLLN